MHWYQRVIVRRVLPFTCCCLIQVGSSAAVEPQRDGGDELSLEPYVVFVAQDQAYTRCGPSDEYYQTDPLRLGQELEVYVETDDGWLGVRPPEESFCWVPADAVEVDTNREHGTVIEDRTVAWIGTHLGRARKYRWQVQLADGESVTVIGRSEREGPDGPQLWYRIVPPSGEFRWVHRDQVVDSAEKLVASNRSEPPADQVEFLPAGPTRAPSQRPIASDIRTTPSLDSTTADTLPSSSRRPDRVAPQPIPAIESPTLDEAPRSRSEGPASQAVGSGLNQDWQSNVVRQAVQDTAAPGNAREPGAPPSILGTRKDRGLLASVEFIGRPKLLDIGTASAPNDTEIAGDANWVAGFTRSALQQPVAQVANQQPITPSYPTAAPSNVTNGNGYSSTSRGQVTTANLSRTTVAPALRTLHVVAAEQVSRVEAETRGADVDRLSLILSRLMASAASAAEAEPVARAAGQLASSSADQVVTGRARLLAERVRQYQRVADRRDGNTVIRSEAAPAIPAEQASLLVPAPPTPSEISQSGFLVQVYSARTNSPPFALTDHRGATVAYVTPTPGVNLRIHLNSYVNVSGSQGYLQGMNTPHILVTTARRSVE